MKIGVATSVPGRRSRLEREAMAMLSRAREKILLRNPYLMRHGFHEALASASRRGVDVRVVTADDHNDSMIHQGYVRSWYPYLQNAGVEVREYRHHFSHTKALTTDGRYTLLGSFNFNNRSSALDFEAVFIVDDESFAAEVENRLYREDMERGVLEDRHESIRTFMDLGVLANSIATHEVLGTFL